MYKDARGKREMSPALCSSSDLRALRHKRSSDSENMFIEIKIIATNLFPVCISLNCHHVLVSENACA